MTKVQQIVKIAQKIADETPNFHKVKGPGKGDKANHVFMAELRKRVESQLGIDYSEKQISGEIKSAVDFFLPDEKTIVEIALTLKVPLSEFHKDIFKALLAKDEGVDIEKLVFISKPGAKKRHNEPASKTIMKWLNNNYSIEVEIFELK